MRRVDLLTFDQRLQRVHSRRGDVARCDRGRKREADRGIVHFQFGHERQADRNRLFGFEVADVDREDVRAVLLKQECTVALRDGLVVLVLRFSGLLDQAREDAVIGDYFKVAHGRALRKRERVHRLDRPVLEVDERLLDRRFLPECDQA
jgi:hypothetical protein